MARIIAICNQKGGVGKTTTAMNLGAYLAAFGKKILLVDFDPQANASSGLGAAVKFPEKSVYHGVIGESLPEDLIKELPLFNFHLIPSSEDLAGLLVELVSASEREQFLRKFLLRLRHLYDYIVIDLPPSLSLLTVNGLVAADEVLIPIQCEYYSLEGLKQLLKTVELINKNLRSPLSSLKVAGALLTMYDKREHLSQEVSKEVRRHFPHRVFEVEIPRAVALAEAPSFGKPIVLYSMYSSGARAYERLAREIIEQESQSAKS